MWRSDEPGYFHICTDGNAVPWIFQDDEDFIAGINRIGICSVISKTETVAYTLMDNHGHFLMYEQAKTIKTTAEGCADREKMQPRDA